MADLLRQGAAWLQAQLKAHAAGAVEYRRGDDAWTVDATYGQTRFEAADADGFTMSGYVWDFLIAPADLGFEPRRGDLIVADGRRFEVIALGEDIDGWRWSDPYRQMYRVHTRDIGADS